jgi:hypothetical protein
MLAPLREWWLSYMSKPESNNGQLQHYDSSSYSEHNDNLMGGGMMTQGGGGGNSSASSHNVFALGGELYLPVLSGFMIGLVVFTIIFEFILHQTEHRLAKHPHHLKMLAKVYKELTILGFISMLSYHTCNSQPAASLRCRGSPNHSKMCGVCHSVINTNSNTPHPLYFIIYLFVYLSQSINQSINCAGLSHNQVLESSHLCMMR